jgi:ADP-heptose:LPS heptosyltransferase
MARTDSRLAVRSRVLAHALGLRLVRGPRHRPGTVRRVLIAHHLLAGDTFMLTPLLAKLREQYPQAAIVMTMQPALVPLYAGRPYGVEAVPFDPRDPVTLKDLLGESGFDLALVPGDNRYSWLAAALDAAWIVAFAGDRPAHKSWMIDEQRPYRATPAGWADMTADLIDGPAPQPYRAGAWPMPPAAPFDRPNGRYAVLHVEASTPLRHWEDQKWLALAEALSANGLTPVWSAGPRGESYLRKIDHKARFAALGHRLDLPQLWHLVAGAALLVCPDTSVSHLGKLVFTPTVTLYGPGSALLFGKGEFWRDAPFREVTIPDFPCRDQQTLFKRRIEWVRRCQRSTSECTEPRCMQAIGVEQVLAAAATLGAYAR